MGHYLACRRYGLPATLPYFLPSPVGIGTFGAFIRIQAPIRSKRELFDVGVAGPIAGFVALVPFLLYGVAHSRVATVVAGRPRPGDPALVPGPLASPSSSRRSPLPRPARRRRRCSTSTPSPSPPGSACSRPPSTCCRSGQLDGGHILYAAVGRLQRRLALPALARRSASAGLCWPGWWLWCVIVLVMGLRHPPVRDEPTPLDARRRVRRPRSPCCSFVLSFMPVPIAEVIVR